MLWFKSLAQNHTKSKRLPAEQIERALNTWCQPLLEPNSGKYLSLSPKAINNIRNLLSNFEDPIARAEWSRIPRIFTILRAIGRLDAMPDFVDGSYRDDMLPLNEHDLPQSLGASKPAFMKFQPFCLTQAAELEKGENGSHVQFQYNGDEHFYQIKELGSGGFGQVLIRLTDYGLLIDVDGLTTSSRSSASNTLRARNFSVVGVINKHGNASIGSREVSAAQRARWSADDWLLKEIGALKRLSHRHLVKIKGTYADPNCFAFLMKPVADCNLQTYLDRMTPDYLPNLRNFFGCLASAVTYLHQTEVHHMDIKLLNILVKQNRIYLTDFGAAHDWSQRDRSTTWAASPRTARYMAPEQASDANAPKNYSVDIWSLGVVFLEMTTVLRGARIKDLYSFMNTHGTKGPYAYNNLQAVYDWLDRLRSREGPEYDNLPMMWVRDMLMKSQYNRPHARKIKGQILSAHGFCGSCCALEQDQWDDLEMSKLDQNLSSEEGSVAGFFDAEEQHIQFKEDVTTLPEPARYTAIQSWIDRTEVAGVQIKKPPDPARAADGVPAPTLASATVTAEDLPFDVEDDDSSTEDDSRPKPISAEIFFNSVPARLANLNFSSEIQEPRNGHRSPDTEGSAELVFDVESDDSGSHMSSHMSSPDVSVHASDLVPLELLCEMPGQSQKALMTAATSYANLDSIEEAEESDTVNFTAILGGMIEEDVPVLSDRIATPTQDDSPQSQESPLDKQEAHSQMNREFESPPAVPPVDGELAINIQIEGTTATPGMAQHGIEFSRRLSKESDIAQAPEIEIKSLKPPSVLTQLPEDKNVHDDLRQEAPSKEPTRKKIRPPSPEDSDQSDEAMIAPGSGAPLTAKNLKALNSKVSPRPKAARRPARSNERMSAKKYMQQVCQKPSEAATSVMSERTRNQLKGLTFTVWTDKSSPVLEQYVRKGNAAAVRHLISAGCNPGTKRKPRIGPLLAAVKGASLRHNKCADSLLRAGADVNAKTSHSGKTMLSLAIEHQDFPGYRGLIWTLLFWGADPNIKDKNGDYALLQILYNGYDPLEEHKRQALALILEASQFPTDVNVEPPGTLNKPLHLAARRKDPWAVGMLLEKGARPNERNGAGQTPFAVAVSTWSSKMTDDHKEVARLLVEAGVEVNELMGANKVPALHSAIKFCHVDLVNFLISFEADPLQRDAQEQTAYSLCEDLLGKGKLSQNDADEIKAILDSRNRNKTASEVTSRDRSGTESTR